MSEAATLIRQRVGQGPAYLTFDIDFVDLEVGGFISYQCRQLIRGLRDINFIGHDVVGVVPMFDSAGIAATSAAGLVYEFISLIALQRT